MREIGEIELSIQGGTEEIEALGEAGKVEESMEKLAAVDALKQLKSDKEKELQILNENAGASGHQKLRVCEICGAMLSVLDSDKRLADHFGGKMHLGFHELRKIMGEWAEQRMRGPSHSHSHAHGHSSAPTGAPPSSAPPPPAGARPAVPPFPLPSSSDKRDSSRDREGREAGELVEDGAPRGAPSSAGGPPPSRYDDRDRDRSDRDRSRGDRYDDRGDRDRYGGRSSDRYGDRGGDRYGGGGGDRYDDRERRDRYSDDRRRSERSRSPSKRRVV